MVALREGRYTHVAADYTTRGLKRVDVDEFYDVSVEDGYSVLDGNCDQLYIQMNKVSVQDHNIPCSLDSDFVLGHNIPVINLRGTARNAHPEQARNEIPRISEM